MRFTKRCHGVPGGVRQAEVPPSDPPVGPFLDLRIASQQVDSEVRGWCIAARLSDPRTTDKTTVGKFNYPSKCAPMVHLSNVVRNDLADYDATNPTP